MKNTFFLGLTLAASIAAHAGGLNQKLVPANSRWLLHLDVDAFRAEWRRIASRAAARAA